MASKNIIVKSPDTIIEFNAITVLFYFRRTTGKSWNDSQKSALLFLFAVSHVFLFITNEHQTVQKI